MIDVPGAVDRFERSTRAVLDALDGVSEQAWNLRPAGAEWSLAETVEHVVLTDRAVRARLEQLSSRPLDADTKRFDDAAICSEMFATAGPPPPGLAEPKGCFGTPGEGMAAFTEVRDEIVAWVRSSRADLRAHGLPHPVFGVFDGVQWILFAAAHTDNHLPDLCELRSKIETAGGPSR